MEVPELMMCASNAGLRQRVFRLLCIETVAIFENYQLNNPFSKVDLYVFLMKESTEAYCLRFERRVFHLIVICSEGILA